jgi:hypothetical protein
MNKNKYILMVVVLILLGAGAWFYFQEAQIEKDNREVFVYSIKNMSQDALRLAAINGFDIENEYNGSFNINGYKSAPYENRYFTDRPASLTEFASSTGLTVDDVNMLLDFVQKHTYLAQIRGNVNLNGQCKSNSDATYTCSAVEFYIQPSLLTLWLSDPAIWYSNGYMYIPFPLTKYNQSYLDRYFGSVQEIAPNWYQFSGEHQ